MAETWSELRTDAQPRRVVSEPGYERWDGNGALGYLVLHAVCEAQVANPPDHARLVVCGETFPTGMLGYWVRQLADGGLVAALTATSPRRLGHPEGGPPLAGTNPLAIAIQDAAVAHQRAAEQGKAPWPMRPDRGFPGYPADW